MSEEYLKKPEVLLSIVTWNHEKTIRDTVDSIANQSYGDFKVVVFDNNSSDRTIEILREFEGRTNFGIIENTENIGFCGGHNYVIKNYSFDFIFLVNPDIILTPDYIGETLRAFEIDPTIGAVCGLLLQSLEANPIIDSTGMQLTRSRRFVLKNHGRLLDSVDLQSEFISGLDGALPAFKNEAVQSMLINGNFFNPMFFSHKEDWDISWRLILFGWKTYFNKKSVAVHPRFFRPGKLKLRKKIDGGIKYHGFKNQFLLLLINEDKNNFLRDFLSIVPRIIMTTMFCVFFERGSLKAYAYIVSNKKDILAIRKQVQERRKIEISTFREHILNSKLNQTS